MTKYEQINQRIESLQCKADEADSAYIRSIWQRHVHQLKYIRANMTIKEASEEVHL